MRYGVSFSTDLLDGCVVIRDFQSTPPGRVYAIIPRDSKYEGEQIAQKICDLLNKELTNELGTL
jgi:hypothetical protein